jgi:signal transduction protein with GAF and PtsI domain
VDTFGASSLVYEDCSVVPLNRIADRISNANQLRDVFNEAVGFVAAALNADACTIYMLEGEDFVLRASSEPYGTSAVRVVKKARRDLGRVAEQLQTTVIPEMADRDPRFRLFNKVSAECFEAFVSVPMISGGRRVGVINAQSHLAHEYTEREVGLVSTLGLVVATRIEIIRLNDENASLALRLESCEDIEQATSILKIELGLNQEDAYLFLQRESRQRRKPMREIAAAIILRDRLKNPSNSECRARMVSPENPELLS